MIYTTLFALWAMSAAALTKEDQAWMMKVDYRNIKTATDRCKTIRRSCLAFGEEPIPASDWAWILKGLSPEERELMRRRYSIKPEGMAAANGQAVRAARPRGDEYRDAVGSTPVGFREEASGRIGRLTGRAPALPVVEPPSPPEVEPPAPVPTAPVRRVPPVRRASSPPPPAQVARPVETEGIPAGRLARMNSPFLQAATSGRFTAASLEPALRWRKENPPLNGAERALRERLGELKPMIGHTLSGAQKETVKAVMKEVGLTLTAAQEANIIRAIENGLNFWDRVRLSDYR